MKFIKFDTTNCKQTRTGEPIIRFNKVGLISISKTACLKLKLEAGDKISIVQDEENPDDWYLLLDEENGFELREYKETGGLFFQSAYVSKAIIGFMAVETKSISFKLATEKADNSKMKLFAILTATAKYTELTTE